MSSHTAKKWACGRCGMSVGQMDGQPTPLPENWVATAEGNFCLACRRERASEVAVEAAPSDSSREVLYKLRRSSLIEFEVRRTPDRPDTAIAKACHASTAVVKEARQRLVEVG